MKKIFSFIIISIITILSTNIVFWDCSKSECMIKDWPNESLDWYLANIKKVVWNLTYKIWNTKNIPKYP